jgi:hypothetical protein
MNTASAPEEAERQLREGFDRMLQARAKEGPATGVKGPVGLHGQVPLGRHVRMYKHNPPVWRVLHHAVGELAIRAEEPSAASLRESEGACGVGDGGEGKLVGDHGHCEGLLVANAHVVGEQRSVEVVVKVEVQRGDERWPDPVHARAIFMSDIQKRHYAPVGRADVSEMDRTKLRWQPPNNGINGSLCYVRTYTTHV